MDKSEIEKKIEDLEREMSETDFWADKNLAQAKVKELQDLKESLLGFSKYDKGNAIITILSGAGGDDAEDFSGILLNMYMKYIESKAWGINFIHEHKNDHGGYRNVTFEVVGRGAYGELKNESGVHRLVRVSPFNSKSQRHTSFSMVEVIPKFLKSDNHIEIPENDLRFEFTRSGGPGGQNVNKRETAVRIVHIPTNMSAHSGSDRTQEQNRENALNILKAKLYKKQEEDKKKIEEGMQISKTTEIEWGNQIRSYVMHPYKMVKDHRTGIETSQIDDVLEAGKLDGFIEAEKNL